VLRRPEFAPLLADIGTLPAFCDRAQLAARSSFWFGPAGTVTPLHHDTIMLCHTQIVGRKRWRFVSPLQWPRVYNHSGVFSAVDVDHPDLARHPAFAQATVLEVVVEPGETVFLPLGWWHQVRSLDVSLSFSYSNLALPNQYPYDDPAITHW
jgi:ribosomal protein L16 Arg81 hydroxylase